MMALAPLPPCAQNAPYQTPSRGPDVARPRRSVHWVMTQPGAPRMVWEGGG